MLMIQPIFSDGKEYISAIRASKKIGYASDYIGQLCRAKKIPGQLIGRTWYVDYVSLVEHKKNRQLGKPHFVKASRDARENFKKNQNQTLSTDSKGLILDLNVKKLAEIILPKSFNHLAITYENDDRPRLPELSKRARYVESIWNANLLKKATALSLALIVAISAGFATLYYTAPIVATSVEQKMTNVSNIGKKFLIILPTDLARSEQLVATSIFGGIDKFFEGVANGFRNLKDLALSKIFVKQLTTNNPLDSARGNQQPTTEPKAVTQVSQPLNLEYLKSELKEELENYVRIQINAVRSPAVVYSSSPAIASADFERFKANEVVPVVYYAVSNQSDSDSDRLSSIISNLTSDGQFTKATFNTLCLSSDCRTSWPSGGSSSGSDFAWTPTSYGVSTSTTLGFLNGFLSTASSTFTGGFIANLSTTTSATTTNFFATTASSTNLFSSALTINGHSFTVNGAPTLNDWFDQSVKTTAAPTFATIDTGQGANELYDMDQNVLTTSNVIFANATTTSATTTNFFSNLFTGNSLSIGGSATSTINSSGDLLVVGSTTLQNFTFRNATGTSATTTNFFATTASSTNLFSSALTINGYSFTVNGAPTLNDWFDQS